MVTTNNYGDNPFAPGMVQDAYLPDQLIAGDAKVVTDSVTLTGAAALARGTALGASITAATAVAAAGSNTGNGVMGAVTASGMVQEGVYRLKIVEAVTNSGRFEVVDPAGRLVGVGLVAAAFNNGGLAFTLADGATDFVAGDSFTITVSAPTVKYKLAVETATDGSDIPVAILADAADPSQGDVTVGIYIAGEFNQNAVTLDTSISSTSAKALLRKSNIYLKSVDTAADPS